MATEAVMMLESKAPMDDGPTFMAAKPKERGDTFKSILDRGRPLRVDATFPKVRATFTCRHGSRRSPRSWRDDFDADNNLSCVGQLDPRNVDTSKKGEAESKALPAPMHWCPRTRCWLTS